MNSTSSISANVNNILVLIDTNFKKWKEHIIIVLKCMDLDYALREDRPSDLTSASIAEQRKLEPRHSWTTQQTDSLQMKRVVGRHTRALGLDLSIYTIQSIQNQLQHTKGKWTLNELIAQCVQEKERLKQEKIESAHLASTSQGFGTSKKRKRDNKRNQIVVSGTSKQKVQKKQDKEITYFFCKKAGHKKKTCTKYAAWHEKKDATTHISVTMQGCLWSRMPTDGEDTSMWEMATRLQ
ncbi:hypothetical protein CK203_062152 [Vitis vinifera]|uniref:Uncharacterized protein n=1 Tax=Vitis vinifera TaxID=29760 RepID=A0A438G8U9_VITVI|nr:hypothetical protein CK203_062152 [Vitis vinifera]